MRYTILVNPMISDPSVQYFFRTNSCYGKRALNRFLYSRQYIYNQTVHINLRISGIDPYKFKKNNSHIICVEKATQCFFQKCMRNYRKELPQHNHKQADNRIYMEANPPPSLTLSLSKIPNIGKLLSNQNPQEKGKINL